MSARLYILFFLIALAIQPGYAQSGRAKPKEPPVQTPTVRVPPQNVPVVSRERVVRPVVSPTPPIENEDDESDVIRIDSFLVPIPVTVTDRNNLALRSLTISDFELKIDGRTVEIAEVSRSETPVRLAMLFDNSGSVLAAREFEIDAAVSFFRTVIRPERDYASLFSVSTYVRLEQEMTNDVGRLVSTIRSLPPPSGATALLDAVLMASNYLGRTEGRRVIVIVSDGDDTKTDTTFDVALKTAQNRNCQIYVVKTTDFENFIRTGSRQVSANTRLLTAERRMMEFAKQTGGAVYSPIDRRELENAFRQISAELSEQYVISYYPENEMNSSGEFRKIEVSVKGRDGLNIRTRNGYYIR